MSQTSGARETVQATIRHFNMAAVSPLMGSPLSHNPWVVDLKALHLFVYLCLHRSPLISVGKRILRHGCEVNKIHFPGCDLSIRCHSLSVSFFQYDQMQRRVHIPLLLEGIIGGRWQKSSNRKEVYVHNWGDKWGLKAKTIDGIL